MNENKIFLIFVNDIHKDEKFDLTFLGYLFKNVINLFIY